MTLWFVVRREKGLATGPAEPRMSTDGCPLLRELLAKSSFYVRQGPYPAGPTALSPPPPRHRQFPSYPDERRPTRSLSGESPPSENAESRSLLAGDDPPLTPLVSSSDPTHASRSESLPFPYHSGSNSSVSASTSTRRARSSSWRTPLPQSLNSR